MDDTRPFPIQGDYRRQIEKASHIPWWLAEIAYEQYKKDFGGAQTLERIAERGGFGREELVKLIRKMNLVTNKKE